MKVRRFTPLAELLQLVADEVRALAPLIDAGRDDQWDAPSHSRAVGRVTSGIGDPVANVVTDARRLALRDAVVLAEKRTATTAHLLRRLLSDARTGSDIDRYQSDLRLVVIQLQGARNALAKALKPYGG